MSLGSAIPYLKRLGDPLYDVAHEAIPLLEPLTQQTVDLPSVDLTFADSYELEQMASLMVHPDEIDTIHAKR